MNISNFLEELKEWLPSLSTVGIVALLLFYLKVIRDLYKFNIEIKDDTIKLQDKRIDFLRDQIKKIELMKQLTQEDIVRLTEFKATQEKELKQPRLSDLEEKKRLVQENEKLKNTISRLRQLSSKYEVYEKDFLMRGKKPLSLEEIQKETEKVVERRIQSVRAVILAAGEGTRMRSSLNRSLHPLNFQPLIKYSINACIESGIHRIIIVVGYQAERIRSILGEGFDYVYQEKRLGTGDALKQAIPLLEDFKGELVVLPADAPFITAPMLIQLIAHHRKTRPAATVLTACLPDPSHYGRVIRNGYRQIKRIVESIDASPEELKIKEVNSGIYCFDTQKLLPLLPRLDCNNAKKEYYLTDVIELLNQQGFKVDALEVKDPYIVLGVNTPEELERAWRILERRREISPPS